jgi:hypothetical protein
MEKGIHTAVLAVMADIAKTGILKESVAQLGGAKVRYRGIEAAMNGLSGLLVKHGIAVTAEYGDLSLESRAKEDPGKFIRFATLQGTFTFTASDGTFTTFKAFGEASDSGDKAVVKAMSVAFRTALFQLFVVPTMALDPEADGDGEPTQLEVNARAEANEGSHRYERFFLKTCTAEQRRELEPIHKELKAIAAKADLRGNE